MEYSVDMENKNISLVLSIIVLLNVFYRINIYPLFTQEKKSYATSSVEMKQFCADAIKHQGFIKAFNNNKESPVIEFCEFYQEVSKLEGFKEIEDFNKSIYSIAPQPLILEDFESNNLYLSTKVPNTVVGQEYEINFEGNKDFLVYINDKEIKEKNGNYKFIAENSTTKLKFIPKKKEASINNIQLHKSN